jgi:hypothetical protein
MQFTFFHTGLLSSICVKSAGRLYRYFYNPQKPWTLPIFLWNLPASRSNLPLNLSVELEQTLPAISLTVPLTTRKIPFA